MTVPAPIVYTLTDEAPALATYSWLPIVRAFANAAQISIATSDISLAGRILANFPDHLAPEQKQSDALAQLGALAQTPTANIIKLPNISASVPQLTAAIAELQAQGYRVPDYPANPQTPAEIAIKDRYGKVLGSAVNPVLREGNSDRRVAAAVKQYAQSHPHRVGPWPASSKTHIAHMDQGDFYDSERSVTIEQEGTVSIELATADGITKILKGPIPVQSQEVIDAAVISVRELREFYSRAIATARQEGVLLSLHLKATMMKISDPILFGHGVQVYFQELFTKYADTFQRLGVNPNNGLGDIYSKIQHLPESEQAAIEADIKATYDRQPPLAMVNSERGITNLHVPSDVIIDASMAALIRNGGQMWGADGQPADTLAVIPDRCYATMYQECIRFCQEHGAFDVATMGNVANVGLMAQKAEEYGSHDKTFEIEQAGTVRVLNDQGQILMSHPVEVGDIWRMGQTKDLPIRDWVQLAVTRAHNTGHPAIFWLDAQRAHDAQVIAKVERYLADLDTEGLDLRILDPVAAMGATCELVRSGQDVISVTGNVLRDYLTDLFPILELGTSAKMLSIVPLLAGGSLFETGAGGSAPKHVQQFVAEGHLRWDSLGEFLALAVSLEDLGRKTGNPDALILAATLDQANSEYLQQAKAPAAKVGELDNRGSHFYVARYWAAALAAQDQSPTLGERFAPLATQLAAQEAAILAEFHAAQGRSIDLGGYYHPDPVKAETAMRPSTTFNRILELI